MSLEPAGAQDLSLSIVSGAGICKNVRSPDKGKWRSVMVSMSSIDLDRLKKDFFRAGPKTIFISIRLDG